MPGYVPTTDPSLDDTSMIPAGPDALGIQMRRQLLRDHLAATKAAGADGATGSNAGDSDIGGVPSGGQPSISPAHPAGNPIQLQPRTGNDAYRGVMFDGVDPKNIIQGPQAGAVKGAPGAASPLDQLIQTALAVQAGSKPMTGTNLTTGQSYVMPQSAHVNRSNVNEATAQWIASQERQRGQDANEKALEAAKYAVDAPVHELEAKGKLAATQDERDHAWAINPANPAYQAVQRQGRLADTQEQTQEMDFKQKQAMEAPSKNYPGMTVGQEMQARHAALPGLIDSLKTHGAPGQKLAAQLSGVLPEDQLESVMGQGRAELGRTTTDQVMPKIQGDIKDMLTEVESHSWKYTAADAARTNQTVRDILDKAKASGLSGQDLDDLANDLQAKIRKSVHKGNPYIGRGSVLLGAVTGGLLGERAEP